jgi:hypothetical protein
VQLSVLSNVLDEITTSMPPVSKVAFSILHRV